MTLFFPDVNVWLALSDGSHTHHSDAMAWKFGLADSSQLLFCRYTQLGLLRLLTNPAVMGQAALKVQDAWAIFDRWIEDPLVMFHPEPTGLESAFREATANLAAQSASKWVADCYLMAHAKECGATLVTFDKGLLAFAAKRGCRAVPC